MVHSGDGWQVDLSAEIPEVRVQPRASIEAATRTVLATSMHEDSLFRRRRCWQADLALYRAKSGENKPASEWSNRVNPAHERRIVPTKDALGFT
jgi:hypothetical protein